MMDGVWNAKNLVKDYLAQDIPTRLISFRNYWEIDDATLANPKLYLAHEPLQIDHWPTIITLATAMPRVIREEYDIDTADPVYEVEYSMRTYIWVKGEKTLTQSGEENTTMVRDMLTTVVRDALIDHPSLKSVPRYEHCRPYVNEDSIREEYSDLTLLKGERFMAGAFVAYELRVEERVTREPLSTIPMLAYTVEADLIPKTPGAPAYVIAKAGDTQASLRWKAATWDGGVDPIDSYQIEVSSDGGTTWAVTVADTGSITPEYTVTGLTNGTEYCFRVSAINKFGVGAASPSSNPVTPSA